MCFVFLFLQKRTVGGKGKQVEREREKGEERPGEVGGNAVTVGAPTGKMRGGRKPAVLED